MEIEIGNIVDALLQFQVLFFRDIFVYRHFPFLPLWHEGNYTHLSHVSHCIRIANTDKQWHFSIEWCFNHSE